MDDKTPRKSFARRALKGLALLLVLGALAVAALPRLAGTVPARNAVLKAVNRAVAPSKVGLGGLSVSWTGPIRMTDLSLTDGHGKTLITARQAVLDRGLLALARDRSRLGVLTVDGASIDVERRTDGSIDLVDALRPPRPEKVNADTPAPVAEPAVASAGAIDLTVRVVRSKLTLRSPELAAPITSGLVDMDVRLPSAAGQRLTWRVRMAEPAGGTVAETLGVDGEYDHQAAASPDLSLTLKGVRWPLSVAPAGVVTRGRLDGVLTVVREKGHWASVGDARLLGFDASGPALAGDRLAFDQVGGVWELSETDEAWAIRKFALVCPVATLSATGSIASGEGKAAPDGRVEGKVDLAALARQIPHTLRLRDGLTLEHGSARVVAVIKAEGDGHKATVEAGVSDIVARQASPPRTFTLREPGTATLKATRRASALSVETLAVRTAFLNIDGSGDLEKGVTLNATVDLARIEAQFKDLIDFGAVQLAGGGRMVGDYRRNPKAPNGFLARYAAEFRGLKVAGLTPGPIERDALRFDAAANGPAGEGGLPLAYENVRVNLKSSQDAVSVAATTRDRVTSVNATATLPVTLSRRDGVAALKFVGRWKPRNEPGAQGVVEFDELRVNLTPTDPALARAGAVALAGRGWVDFDADDLQLTPLPAPSPLVLAPDGLKVHGFRKTPLSSRSGKAVVIADIAAVEAALFVWTGRPPSGLGGALSGQFAVAPGEPGLLNLAINVTVPDLSRAGPDGRARTPEGPFAAGFAGAYDTKADRLRVENFVGLTRYARVDASGLVDEPSGRRVADLKGLISPNWETISAAAAAATEPKARLQGRARTFHVRGPLAGETLAATVKGLDAEVGVDLTSADVFGLNLGPAPVVVRCRGGAVTVDPIRTTLNNGRVDLKPGLAVDDVKGIAVLLAKGSVVDGAEVNDEVSRDILSYIAPVLDKATDVRGKISLDVDGADIPVTGPPTRTASMTGRLAFQDVVFAPGPFARQVLGLVGRPDEPGLRLRQPIELSVADGRVYQKGLSVPVSKDAAIAFEGSVGFDQTLDLRTSVPITRGMLGQAAGLDGLVGNNRITVPIGGTVSHPKINRQALQIALRELSRNVLKGELSREASRFLDKLGPPPAAGGPDGPPAGDGPRGLPGDLKGLEDQLLRRVLPRGR